MTSYQTKCLLMHWITNYRVSMVPFLKENQHIRNHHMNIDDIVNDDFYLHQEYPLTENIIISKMFKNNTWQVIVHPVGPFFAL